MGRLDVEEVDAGYGDFQALYQLSLHVDSGETVAIIGANGAGKTTLLRAVMGQVKVRSGTIRYAGQDLAGVPTHQRVRRGMGLVPEGRRLFPSLSVEENLMIGGYKARPGRWTIREVLGVFPLLRPLMKRASSTLSGGEQQAVAIGRTLMSNPELVLLDEVSLGLAPVVVRALYERAAPHRRGRHDGGRRRAGHHARARRGRPRLLPARRSGLAVGAADRPHPRRHHHGVLRGLTMQWVNAAIQGILVGGLYALFATGLSLAFGVMRFVNLAHGDLAILAAYLVLSVSAVFGIGYWASLVLVIVIMAVVGYVGQRGLFNFTLGEDPLPGILVSFGVGIVIQNALQQHYTATDRTIDLGSILTKSITINDDISIGWFPLLTLIVAVVVLLALQLLFSRTSIGRAFRATADDPQTAQLMGINDRRLYGVAMAIAFAAIALAGFFRGARTSFSPTAGAGILLFAFEAVVIGGLGSLWGTLVGGIVLGLAQSLGNQASIGWDLLSGHLVFLFVLLVRPRGLVGRART